MLLNFQYNKKNHMICILVLLQVSSSITDKEINLSYSNYIESEGFQTEIETIGNEKSYYNSSNMQCVPSPYTLPSIYNSNDSQDQQNSPWVSNSLNLSYDPSVVSNSIQNNRDILENISFKNQDCNFIFEQNKFYSQTETNQYMGINENVSLELANQESFNNNTNLLSLNTLQNTYLNYQEYQKDLYQNSPKNNYQNSSSVTNKNKFLYSQNSESFHAPDEQNGFEIKSFDYQGNRKKMHNFMTNNLNEINLPFKKRKIKIIPEASEEKFSNSESLEKCKFIQIKHTSNCLDNVGASDKYLLCPITTDQNNTVLFQEKNEEMPESNPYYNKLVPFLKDLNQNPKLKNNHNMNTRCKKDPHNKYNERCLKNKLKEVKLTDKQSDMFQNEKKKDTTCLDDFLSISSNNDITKNKNILNNSITKDENESKLHFNKKKSNQNKNFKLNQKKESTKNNYYSGNEISDFNINILNNYKSEIININKEIQKTLDLEKNEENIICIINKIIEFLKFNKSENNFRFSSLQSELIEINFFELEKAINSIRTDDIFNYLLPEFEFFSNDYFQTISRNQNVLHATILNTWIVFLKNLKNILRTALDKENIISLEIMKYIVTCFTFIAIEFLFDQDFRSIQFKFIDKKLILKLKFDQKHKTYFFDVSKQKGRFGLFSKYSHHLRFIFLLKNSQFFYKMDSLSSTLLNSEKNIYLKNFVENLEVKNSDFFYLKHKMIISQIFRNLSKHKNKCLPYLKVVLIYCSIIKYKNIFADFLHEIVKVEEEIHTFLQSLRYKNNRSRNLRIDKNIKSIQELENRKKLCIDRKIRQLFLTEKFKKIISIINILLVKFQKKELDRLKFVLKKHK